MHKPRLDQQHDAAEQHRAEHERERAQCDQHADLDHGRALRPVRAIAHDCTGQRLSSNVFAVLGVRALYLLLAGMADRYHLLVYGLAFVLVFIGGNILLEPWFAWLHLESWAH